jgi:transcription-repair coupling factor (superfamily II helicase)
MVNGMPPAEVKILVDIESLRTIASGLKLDEILEGCRAIRIRIAGNSLIDIPKVLKFMKSDKRLTIDPSDINLLLSDPKVSDTGKKILELKNLLQQMAQSVSSAQL